MKSVRQIVITKNEGEQFEKIRLLLLSGSYQYSNLPTLSQMAGITLTNLKDGFKRIYGISIYQYLLQVRIEKSKQLLLNTDLSVKAVGLECGFGNCQHFITTFKKRVSVTPRVYRTMHL